MTPKEYRAKMIRERGKTESTGINPNSPRARLEREKSQKTKRVSITPKERRARDIASRGDNFFTRKAKTPAISERAKKIKQAQADVEKDLPRGKPAPSQMEDYKPTATVKAITKTEKTIAKSPAKSKPGVGAKRAMAGISEFGKAFSKARKEGKKEFPFRGAQYAAITKQEVQKSGASGLGDYLNKLKRSESKIAKAPGQVTKKKGGMSKFQVGGAVNRKEMRELRKMIPSDDPLTRAAAMQERLAERARQRNINLKRQSGAAMTERELDNMEDTISRSSRKNLPGVGAAVSENEMKSIMEQMGKSPAEDRFAKGGSVMARGCKLGKKKPTKLY